MSSDTPTAQIVDPDLTPTCSGHVKHLTRSQRLLQSVGRTSLPEAAAGAVRTHSGSGKADWRDAGQAIIRRAARPSRGRAATTPKWARRKKPEIPPDDQPF
jgi:hypothetical protein